MRLKYLRDRYARRGCESIETNQVYPMTTSVIKTSETLKLAKGNREPHDRELHNRAAPIRRPLWKTMTAVFVASIVAGVSIAVALKFEFRGDESSTTYVVSTAQKQVPVITSVGALGRIEPGWKILKLAPSASAEGSVVESLAADEGDKVSKGQVLATLDVLPRREAALREARAQAQIFAARLSKVKAGPGSQEVAAKTAEMELHAVAYRNAESDYGRVEKLKAANATTAENVDRSRNQLEQSQKQLEQARAHLGALTWIRPEDVQAAEAELAKAEASVCRAEAEVEAARIRSPIDGRLLKLFVRPGERVGESGFAEIGDTDHMQVVAEIHERDAAKVRVGQPAMIKPQCVAEEFQGTVIRVGWKIGRQVVLDNDPVKDTDARVIEVRILLDNAASERLAALSNARVEVRIDEEGGS